MCGIVGIVNHNEVGITLYNALMMLQHRGQDAAGIMTEEQGHIKKRCKTGLINQIFRETRHVNALCGSQGIAHTRYPTAGGFDRTEVQPFYVNSPCGLGLSHNGNLTNSKELRDSIAHSGHRHINTPSDSEVLLNVFARALEQHITDLVTVDAVFKAVCGVQQKCRGAYSVVVLIVGFGIVAFRDRYGVRPLCLGRKEDENGESYMVASESISLDASGFSLIKEIPNGSAIIINKQCEVHERVCVDNPQLYPCLFEYVYLSRPDSVINGVSVFRARQNMGRKLGEKILRDWPDNDIDLVIGVPDTSRVAASELAKIINRPYSEALIKNRYVGRTFIMPGQEQRQKSIKRKLNMVASEVEGKNVLLIDDSIVRGNTAHEIVRMARDSGARKVYLASAAPPISHPNIYGIDMPDTKELLTATRSIKEAQAFIKCDKLIYQTLEDLEASVREVNPKLTHFENSVFSGNYLPNDMPAKEYFVQLARLRNNKAICKQLKPVI